MLVRERGRGRQKGGECVVESETASVAEGLGVARATPHRGKGVSGPGLRGAGPGARAVAFTPP
jgi:hypothetical protein